jgi:hypothetical protein
MLSISIDGNDQDDLSSIISESFGPEAVSAAIAEVAREALAEAEAINTAALGRSVPYTTLVDGRESSDLDRVRPDGSIVGIFDLTIDLLTWIEAQLVIHSPVRTGRYQKSHRVFVDGVETAIADIQPGVSRIVFAPLSAYAPEIEPHGRKPGESRKAPDGVYQAVAALARQRFGAVADISFTYLPIPGVEQPAHSPPPAVEPAIIVDL